MEFQVITWSVSDPFGTLWKFANLKEADAFLCKCAEKIGLHYKVLD